MLRRQCFFSMLVAVLGCGSTPENGVAVCPRAPEQGLLSSVTEPPPAGDATRGAALFERECSRCHSVDLSARGSRFFRAYPRLDCADYLAQVTDRYLFVAISEGGLAVGRNELMKPFSELLTEQEIADLVAFLRAGT